MAEVKSKQYGFQPVRQREDCLLLYGPYVSESPKNAAKSASFSKNGAEEETVSVESKGSYDLVVQSDKDINYCYSVFRTDDESAADER